MFFKKKIKPLVFDKPEDYFPYIGHRLDEFKDQLNLKESVMGQMKYKGDENTRFFYPDQAVYESIELDIHKKNFEIARDPDAVNILLPRHRSLFDFTSFQPIHHDLINQKIMILAGHNLFVRQLNKSLRAYGGFVFLRDDAVLEYENLPPAFLDKEIYFKDVLPAYLKDQVFCKDKTKHDMMVYLEYEKDARTGRNNGGRTKTGELRHLNWAMIKLIYDLAVAQGVKTYITPVNVGFSKIPDAPYTVHPPKSGGTMRALRYMFEQSFVYQKYGAHAEKHKEAKLKGINRYGEPELVNDMDFSSLRSFKRYAEHVRTKIGELETVFPLYLINKAMGQDASINMHALEDRIFHIHEHLKKKNVRMIDIEDSRGNLIKTEEMVVKAIAHLNSNPTYHMGHIDGKHLLYLKKNYLHSNELRLQLWYADNILHFDKESESFL